MLQVGWIRNCILLCHLFYFKFEIEIDKEWQGNWFPKKPGEMDPQLDDNMVNNEIDTSSTYKNRMKTMGITDPKCDDAEVIDNS